MKFGKELDRDLVPGSAMRSQFLVNLLTANRMACKVSRLQGWEEICKEYCPRCIESEWPTAATWNIAWRQFSFLTACELTAGPYTRGI